MKVEVAALGCLRDCQVPGKNGAVSEDFLLCRSSGAV